MPSDQSHEVSPNSFCARAPVTLKEVLFDEIEELVRNCDYPAMRQNPLQLIMFPNSDHQTEEEEIKWQITGFQETFEKVPSAFFRQVCLDDGTAVAFALWTVDSCDLPDHTIGRKSLTMQAKQPIRLPSSLDIANWRETSKILRAERERVLRGRKNVWRLNEISVAPAHQRCGFGSMLLRWGCEQADKRGMVSFVMASPAGVALYHNFGYKTVRQVEIKQAKFTSMLREPCASMSSA